MYLNAGPLLWLTATVLAYLVAFGVHARLAYSPLANPVLLASTMLIGLLLITGTRYEVYFSGAQFVHFMLGPATVALAIPLFRNLTYVRRSLIPILAALLAGSVTAILSAVAIMAMLGAPHSVLSSIAVKSTSTPIAMELAKSLGGVASLAAALVMLTGIIGSVIVTPLMNALRIDNYAARGFAAGVAAHGLGTARAFQVSDLAGAFSGMAMAMNGVLTSLLVLLWSLWT